MSLDLGVLWRELTLGVCRVVDTFCSESTCYLLTAPVEEAARPLSAIQLRVLEALLTGSPQKTIAIDLGIAPSTVAAHARAALRHLGLTERPSQVQPLLMLSAKSARALDVRRGRVSFLEVDGETIRVITIPRPDMALANVPPAELMVLRCLVEGMPYCAIAERRGTSMRTIANQLAAVFRRFRVSGRGELIHRLLEASVPAVAAPR